MTESSRSRRGVVGKSRKRPPDMAEKAGRNSMIPGFQGVKETLEATDGAFREIWIAQGKSSPRTTEIAKLAAAKNIPVHFKKKDYLSNIFGDVSHQGIVGIANAFAYSDFHQMLRVALGARSSALLLAADHITDSGNLGALMRTAAFFGSHGLIIPKDRSAGVTPAVLKRSAGAHGKLSVARVTNLNRALDECSQNGLWIIGAAGEAKVSVYDFDWRRPLVLVLGNEQKGLSPSTRKGCHELVAIPSFGNMESLNISVAGGVMLSEICRQRQGMKP